MSTYILTMCFLAPCQAFSKFLPVTSIPWYDGKQMMRILRFCGELTAPVPVSNLFFLPDHPGPGLVQFSPSP